MGNAYAKATRAKAPQGWQCIDPFLVIKLAREEIETARRWAWNNARAGRPHPGAREWPEPHHRPRLDRRPD